MHQLFSWLLFITLLAITVSCNKQKERSLIKKESDSIVVYNEVEYRNNGGGRTDNKKKFKIIDTACSNGIERAKNKANKDIFKYYFHAKVGFLPEDAEYLKKIFSRKGITVDFYYVVPTCIPLREGPFKSNCFEKAMNDEFRKKYGAKLADSIEKAKFELVRQ